MMLTRLAAQALIDGFSALTLGASVAAVARRRPGSALTTRLCFAFGGIFALFAARTAYYVLGSTLLHLLALIVACILPLAALLLAEGILRRHAPWPLKILVTAGALAMAIAIIAAEGLSPVATWWLGGYVILSLLSVLALLLLRDRTSLSRQENAGVLALIASGSLLTALSATDFLPSAAVGVSGIGCAAVASVLGANPSTRREVTGVLGDVLIMGAASALAALLLAMPLALHGAADQFRLGAILLSLLLAANAMLTIRRGSVGRHLQEFTHALANADTSTLDAFLNSLARQPLLADLRIAEGDMLAEYDAPGLGEAMAARAVWTRVALQDGVPERAREELGDLLSRSEASHVVMISRAPLRIALLALPGADPGVEIALALFHKLAAVAARETP